jgi:hypothetical protein
MKDRSKASAPAKVAEAIDLNKDTEIFENIKIAAAKGGSPVLSLEQQIVQLNSTVARLSRELETVKAQLQEKTKDIAVDLKLLWENSDLHFDNEKKLQNALKTHSRGPVMEGRIERIIARLKGQGNAWLAKRDLHGWLGLKSRQLAHVLYSLCIADGRFETVKRGKYVYLRLRPLSAT